MFSAALIWIFMLTSARPVRNQLIRPVPIYQDIIDGIHDYFNNTCIILLHATENPMRTQGLAEGMQLQRLQAYLSSRHIRTTSMDFRTFKKRVGYSYFHIKRPLFVLLNDSDDVKYDFTHVNIHCLKQHTSRFQSMNTCLGYNTAEPLGVNFIEQTLMVTGWIDMSYPTWLIFFRDETRIEDFFMDIYVPFDCTFMVAQGQDNDSNTEIITEVYQVDRNKELRQATFGTWHPEHGITTPRLGLYQRRSDLYGQIIRVTSIHDPPGSLIVRNDDGKMVSLGGFFGGILELLQENMNCTIIYHESQTWGHYLDNGTWTGAIGMLTNNAVDIIAAELMMTGDRLDAVDFTTPVYSTKCRTFIKRPSTSPLKWKVYITPFHSGIWSSIGILIIVTSASISLVKFVIPIISANMDINDNSPSNLVDIILAVYGAFCSQGMDQSLLDPIRIIHQVIHLTGVVVLAAYSAALISSLAVKSFVMPFTTMEGLLQDGTYRFAVVGDSADYSFFQNTSDKILQVLFDEVLTKEATLPNNYLDGLQRVCAEEKYAFMTLDTAVSQLQPKVDCKLEALDTIMQSSVAMAVRPRSPYRGIINTNILLIRDSGILQRLLNSEWTLTDNNLDSSWTTVEINDVLPLVLVILGGILCSLITLGSEQVVARKMTRRRKKRPKETKIQPHINFPLRNDARRGLFGI